MGFSIFPKEYNFFDSFDKQVDNVVEAADCFRDIIIKGEVGRDLSALQRCSRK